MRRKKRAREGESKHEAGRKQIRILARSVGAGGVEFAMMVATTVKAWFGGCRRRRISDGQASGRTRVVSSAEEREAEQTETGRAGRGQCSSGVRVMRRVGTGWRPEVMDLLIHEGEGAQAREGARGWTSDWMQKRQPVHAAAEQPSVLPVCAAATAPCALDPGPLLSGAWEPGCLEG